MSAIAAKSARPAWAVTCWVDDYNVYTEIACSSGPPFIQSYPLTEGGLSKALAFMRNAYRKHEPKGGAYPILQQANISKPTIQAFEPEARKRAQEILKKLRIT